MSQVLAWGGMALAFGGVIWGKIVLAAALDGVKARHPRAFAAMSDYGTPGLKNLSPVESRVRRALAAKMLTGRLPAGAADDPALRRVMRSWRLTVAVIVAGFAMTALGLSLGRG